MSTSSKIVTDTATTFTRGKTTYQITERVIYRHNSDAGVDFGYVEGVDERGRTRAFGAVFDPDTGRVLRTTTSSASAPWIESR